MKLAHAIAAGIITLGSAQAWAQCTKPTAPAIPDGSTAEKDAFYAAYQEAKNYLAEADKYLVCLTEEEKAEMEQGESTEETQAARLDLYNQTVDEMQALGETLNTEVAEFKAREQ